MSSSTRPATSARSALAAGFRGKNTAHRVTTVEGERERMIAVFSYYEKPA